MPILVIASTLMVLLLHSVEPSSAVTDGGDDDKEEFMDVQIPLNISQWVSGNRLCPVSTLEPPYKENIILIGVIGKSLQHHYRGGPPKI